MIRGNPVHTLFVKATIWFSIVFGQSFNHSTVMPVPDLSFHPSIFYGLDVLEQMDFKPLYGKTIGVFTNQTAVNRKGTHLLDLLRAHPKIDVEIIFTPQYGLFAQQNERFKIQGDQKFDPIYNARIVEVFGRNVKPPEWAMRGLELILIDIQDTGVRYSTYVTTITKIMEVASEWSKPVMVLDRPNPLRGDRVDGPVVRPQFQSFEGYHLVPIRHGMTIGEMAIMANEMGWIKNLKRVNLTVIPMANWKRDTWFDQTQLSWKHPIPFIRDSETLLAYAGMDLFRGTNLNAGFGTDHPYLYVGAPWLVANFFLEKLNDFGLRGVLFEEIKYRPWGSIYYNRIPKYDGLSCSGIKMSITDKNEFDPISTATSIIMLIHHLHPREFQWTGDGYIDKLFGSDLLRTLTAQNKSPEMLPPQWVHDVYLFNQFRQPYLIYP